MRQEEVRRKKGEDKTRGGKEEDGGEQDWKR